MGVSRIFHATLITYLIVHVGATCDKEDYPKCPLDEYFHCQMNITNEYSRIAFCAKRVLCEAGTHSVLTNANKTVTCEECAWDMYQPVKKWSNTFTQPNCDYRVKHCNEQQRICEKATSIQNNKCACNHTAGYKPDNTAECLCFSQDSSVCECVKADCTEEEVLTEDYICNSSSSSTTTSNTAGISTVLISAGTVVFIIVAAISFYYFYKRRQLTEKEKTDSMTDGDEDGISAELSPLTSYPNSQAIVTKREKTDSKTDGGGDDISASTSAELNRQMAEKGVRNTNSNYQEATPSHEQNEQMAKMGEGEGNTNINNQGGASVIGTTGGRTRTSNAAHTVKHGMGNRHTYNITVAGDLKLN